jgi:hypothetical protein
MKADAHPLLVIAERIAEAENRVVQLRERIERLKREGSDAVQALETLQAVSGNLASLYVEQSLIRRMAWAKHPARAALLTP